MTWTKLSDDFGDQCAELTDAAFRTHVEGLLWTMRRETGGRLAERDLRRFAECADPQAAAAELVHRGWWKPAADGGWLIVHHLEHQPEPDVIAARRAMAAERQRRKRRKAAQIDKEPSRRDDSRDDPRDPGRDGTGRDGTGKAASESDEP
jgi:hypothetical protein